VLHFEPRGTLAPGAPADVVLIDLDRKWEVTRDGFLSKSKNSPYVGRQLQGGIEATIVGGRVVYRDGRIVV